MSSTHPVRIGVIGCGVRLRGVLRHLLQSAPSGRIQLAAVYDPHPKSRQAVRDELGVTFAEEASEETLVRRADIDWVFIGSWNSQHSRQAILALLAGRHVFCEKPLATNLDDCLAIRAAVEKSGRTFAFGLVLRYSPLYQKVHQIVSSGRLGQLISFEFNETLGFNHGGYIFGNWRRNTKNAGSHLLEKCCHDLDLANWIIGSLPVRVASFGGRDFFCPENAGQVEQIGPNSKGEPAYSTWADQERVSPFSDGADIVDNQVAILEYANGVRATFHTNCNAAILERRFYICGTKGALRADAISGIIEVQRIGHNSEPEQIDTGLAGGHAGGDDRMGPALAETLLHGKPPLASIDEGIRSSTVAFAIDRAMAAGQVVDLHPDWLRCGIPATVARG
jgi:predicted dehydrogenase